MSLSQYARYDWRESNALSLDSLTRMVQGGSTNPQSGRLFSCYFFLFFPCFGGGERCQVVHPHFNAVSALACSRKGYEYMSRLVTRQRPNTPKRSASSCNCPTTICRCGVEKIFCNFCMFWPVPDTGRGNCQELSDRQ